jgi:hypothetical protein
LSRDLDIRLNTAIKNIKYYDGGVEVTAEDLKTNNSKVVHKGEKAISSFHLCYLLGNIGDVEGEVAR